MTPSAERADAHDEERRALLSALADGEADSALPGCELWRDDAQARATWHTYHLIGDVLRSDDLAVQPARDVAFLDALRARLADEPVVLAPAPTPAALQALAPAAARRRHAWVTPAAVAAGFMAVAGVLVVARMAGPGEAEAPLLVIGGPSAQSGIRLTGGQGAAAGTLVVEGRVIRDAQLDAYLRAHREAMGGAPVALPGGVPRNIATLEPEGPAAAVPASAVR
ncbi:sigma-E factor negative regulatory protein [Rubrivivax sp. RP6-9]|uniref:sigma-E factor negative regulatory protein n=1 Tax=Rubrivivax sp. RP6-9 TaxID=3415750 RepID=UPI003CC50D91